MKKIWVGHINHNKIITPQRTQQVNRETVYFFHSPTEFAHSHWSDLHKRWIA